jgi:mRNA interferase MazF
MTAKLTIWAPERGDIIWINNTPSAGREMPDHHPMLVASSKTFNRKTGIVIGFPMTHAAFNADNPFAVKIIGPKNEIAYVLAFQPKSYDWQARGARQHHWGGGHNNVLDEALYTLNTICGIRH